MESKMVTKKIGNTLAVRIINNTDQHLFLTDEKFKDLDWEPNTNKPNVIEKIWGDKRFNLYTSSFAMGQAELTWTGGCNLFKTMLNITNSKPGIEITIKDTRYGYKMNISSPPSIPPGSLTNIDITLYMHPYHKDA